VLADVGTRREDRGVEHLLVSPFPFLPASDYPRLEFQPSEQNPRELMRCRGGGYRAEVEVRVRKVGFSAAGKEGSAFLLIFQKLGVMSAFKTLKTQKKILEKESCSLLWVFFCTSSLLQLLWQAVDLP